MKRRKQPRRARQQGIGRFGRGDQHRGRLSGGDGAGVAALHAQRHAQMFQRRRQSLVEIAHQRARGANVEDAQLGAGRLASGRAQHVPLQQRRQDGLGLARGRGRNDQGVAPREDGRNRLLLDRGEAAVASEEGGPGVEKGHSDRKTPVIAASPHRPLRLDPWLCSVPTRHSTCTAAVAARRTRREPCGVRSTHAPNSAPPLKRSARSWMVTGVPVEDRPERSSAEDRSSQRSCWRSSSSKAVTS